VTFHKPRFTRDPFTRVEDLREHIIECSRNPLYFFDTELKIITKEGTLVNLNVNSVQIDFIKEFVKLYNSSKPVRILVLKARQMGATTITSALNFWHTIFHPYKTGFILTHDDDAKDHVFTISKRFLNYLTEELKPTQKYSNKKELAFQTPDGKGLNSQLQVDIASPDVVSKTIHFFHGSEVSRWNKDAESYVAAMQMISDHADSVVVLESTANGMGGTFYELWQDAKAGRNDFTPLFYPWFKMDVYRKRKPHSFIFDDDLVIIKEKYKLSNDQMFFYAWTLRNKCNNNMDLMRQEYPCNDKECFLASGRNAFVGLKFYEGEVIKPNLGEMEEDGDKVRFFPVKGGHVQLWDVPKADHRYVIGIDVSEGIEGGDRSAAVVLDRDDYKIVAFWHGLAAPDKFARYCVQLGKYYNKAILCPEVNASGLSVLNEFRRLGYKNLYSRKEYENIDKKFIYKLGWRTTSKTRPLLINELHKIIRERQLRMHSNDILNELTTFVYNDAGKAEALSGCHDDLVIALGIAMWCHQELSLSNPPQKKVLKTRLQRMIEHAQKDTGQEGFINSYLGDEY